MGAIPRCGVWDPGESGKCDTYAAFTHKHTRLGRLRSKVGHDYLHSNRLYGLSLGQPAVNAHSVVGARASLWTPRKCWLEFQLLIDTNTRYANGWATDSPAGMIGSFRY